MKPLRFANVKFLTNLDRDIPLNVPVTIMHLGRGGVLPDGTLDDYTKDRVLYTLSVADNIVRLRPRAKVRILWTGGCSRKLDRKGTELPATEAKAAMNYAKSVIGSNNYDYAMDTETRSTSTVENATRSAELIRFEDVIVVVSDPLHYVARKVQFIMRLVFPHHRLVFVELPETPPGTNHWLFVAAHLVSTLVTRIGMIGVTRGSAVMVQRRQNLLQRLTRH